MPEDVIVIGDSQPDEDAGAVEIPAAEQRPGKRVRPSNATTAAAPAVPPPQQPAWHKQQGTRRIMSEFKYLTQQVDKGNAPQLSDLELVGDDILKWRLKVKNFDNDVPAGKDLNSDLQRLKHRYGQDHMLMEIAFDADYPQKPFFLRVVSPRCVWYTGHVTAGGSICIAALTLSGGAGSWSPDYSVESILNVVITNMLDCERLQVTTASGGGTSGPLRIDLDKRYSHNPMQPYSEAEARMAFSRMEQHHRQNGWGPAGGGGGSASAAAGPSTTSNASAWGGSFGGLGLGAGRGASGFGGALAGPFGASFGGAAGSGTLGNLPGGSLRQFNAARTGAAATSAVPLPGASNHSWPTSPGASPLSRRSYGTGFGRAATGADSSGAAGPRSSADSRQTRAAARAAASQAALAVASAAAKRTSQGGADAMDLTASQDSSAQLESNGRSDRRSWRANGPSMAAPAAQPGQLPIARAVSTTATAAELQGVDPNQDPSNRVQDQGPSRAPCAARSNKRKAEPEICDLTADDSPVVPRSMAAAAAATRPAAAPAHRSSAPGQLASNGDAAGPAAVRPHAPARQVSTAGREQALHAAIEAVDLTIIEDDALDKDELSRMRAEKEALEKQLEELKQQKQRESAAAAAAAAAGAQRARLIDPPAHWRTFTGAAANTRVQYVELPLGGRAAAAPAPAQLAFDKGLVKAMTNQGLSEEDAIAALEHCQGDGEEAMLYAVECLDRGGAATVARRQARKKRDAQAQAGPSQAEEAERKRQQDEVAEVERVLAHFEQGGLRRDRVHRIERVQNLRLWTKYCMRQDEIEHERGTHGINEQLLFHGADQGTIAIITSSGFDIRVSQLSGSLGAGTYFAHCSSYSDAYSKAPAHAVAAAPAPYAYGGAWAAATAGLGPLGVPAGLASGGLGGAGGGGKKGRKSRKMPPPPPPLGFGAMPSSAAYSMAGLAGLGASLGYPFPGALTAAGPYGGAPAGAAAAGAGAIGASRGRPGEASSSSSQAAAQPTSEPATGPRYVQGGFAMLICRVTLGTQGHGGPQMRRPPPGCDSVTTGTAAGKIYAMYDNTQAYPEWCVHYE